MKTKARIGWLILTLALLAGGEAGAGTKQWSNGSGDNQWETSGNWSPSSKPTTSDDVFIDDTSPAGSTQAVLTVNANVKTLTFDKATNFNAWIPWRGDDSLLSATRSMRLWPSSPVENGLITCPRGQPSGDEPLRIFYEAGGYGLGAAGGVRRCSMAAARAASPPFRASSSAWR